MQELIVSTEFIFLRVSLQTDKPIDKDKNNEESTKVNEKLVADQKAKADSVEKLQTKQSKIERS